MAEQDQGGRRGLANTRTVLIWVGIVMATALTCYLLKGAEAIEASLRSDLILMADMVPRMAAAILIGGFIQVLVPKGLVVKWLGDKSGMTGVLLATGVGTFTPGGPMLAFPLMVVLRNAGADVPALVAFITAWSTLGIHRVITWEIPLFGLEFAIVRWLASAMMPVLAGLLAGLLVGRWGPWRRRTAP